MGALFTEMKALEVKGRYLNEKGGVSRNAVGVRQKRLRGK